MSEVTPSYLEDEVMPLPNVITSFREDVKDPINWEIVPTVGDFGAKVDFIAGVMAIPLSGDSHSQRLQLQKLIEARVTPLDSSTYSGIAKAYNNNGITADVLRVAEQARINAITEQFAKVKQLDHEPTGAEKTFGKRLATAGDMRSWDAAVQFTVQNHSTKSFDSFASGIRSVKPEWSKRLRQLNKSMKTNFNGTVSELGDTTPVRFNSDVNIPTGFRYTLYAASDIADYVSSGYKTPQDIKDIHSKKEEQRAANYGDPDKFDPDKNTLGDQPVTLNTDDVPDDFEFDYDNGEFGKLVWADDKPLTVEVKGYMRRKKRGMQSGRRVSYPSRLLTDPERRIFGQKIKVKGGIVVIDISGSMNLKQSDIEEIVEAAPAAVIMAYSDCGGDSPNAWLLADRGWRVRDTGDIGGMNNGVDGTALTWAIRRRKHGEDIVWVSDGQVTSMGSGQNDQIIIQCAKLVKKHKIIMIPSVEEAVSMFKKGKLINKPAGPIRSALLGKS